MWHFEKLPGDMLYMQWQIQEGAIGAIAPPKNVKNIFVLLPFFAR